jgi:hypothetical protein
MKIRTNETQQQQAVIHVSETFRQYKELLQPYYERLLDVYKELNSFKYPKKADWTTTFKVNKMFSSRFPITPKVISI